jgi:hypothetical protein
LKAGKAYISSLGTTGLLIASSLLLLVFVGALVAFDAWPGADVPGSPETVAIGHTKQVRARSRSRAGHHGQAVSRRRAAARRTAARRAAAQRGSAGPLPANVLDRRGGVVSNLPAPGSDGSGTSGGGPASPGLPTGPAPGRGTPASTTSGLGDVLSGLDPGAGGAVGQTGDTVGTAVDGATSGILPRGDGASGGSLLP